ILERLLPPRAGKVIEHDDDDLKKMDAPQAAEFFYYENGAKAELLYAKDSATRVIQVNVWTKNA
ncbi:MAG: hypothetical protein K2X27_15470, partial [Candidatus Obscuribacterales bacterium]|nr:hypothetical protein [Candidatus Obscuribacterales bacterium]